MKKVRHYLAGSIFAALGIIFFYLDVTPPVDQMDHGMQMDQAPTGHDVKLLGFGEMTWMWFTMALVHFFLNNR
jgi:riboflavin transporter FmnP